MRPTELFPKNLIIELLRVARINRDWVVAEPGTDPETYVARFTVPTWVRAACNSGGDSFGMHGLSIWLLDGPKTFKPTREQCQALENVDVNLMLTDYAQPFPAMLVEVDYPPFSSVLCFHHKGMLSCTLHTKDHEHDIITTVRQSERPVEDSLRKFDESCRVDAVLAAKALRVACNSCLALVHYGHMSEHLFPKEVANDRKLAAEQTERGQRARERLPLAVQKISFSQEVRIHRTRTAHANETGVAGSSKGPHWRRGHWAMQPCGPGRSERKRILRAPVFVRFDLFVGDKADTETTYKG